MSRRKPRPVIKAVGHRPKILFEAAGVEWIQAAAGEDGKDGEPQAKRFTMTAYTGGPLQVGYYSAAVVIDLAGLKAVAPLPILFNHDSQKIVGHAEEIIVGDKTVKLSGLISGASPEADQITASAALGFPWRSSVGVQPDKLEFVGEGVETQVNGKTFTGPLYVARKSTLHETSFVALAADKKATAQVAAKAAHSSSSKEVNNMNFEKWIEALGFNPADLTESQTAALQAKYTAERKAGVRSQESGDRRQETGVRSQESGESDFNPSLVVLAQARHESAVLAAVAGYHGKIKEEDLARIKAESLSASQKITAAALEIKSDRTIEAQFARAENDAQLALIRAERPVAPAIHASSRDISAPIIEAALAMSAGLHAAEEQFDAKVLEAADRSFKNLGLQELILIAANANGYSGRQRIGRDNIRDVMEYAYPVRPIRAAGFSTVDLSGIVSSSANKLLLDGFNTIPQTWREVAQVKSVQDFKQVTAYRLTADLEYKEVGPDGEITHGTLDSENYTMQAKTYARMLALTRTDIINDDLGALLDIRNRLGIGAAIKMNKVFWTLWINNSAFFTGERGNYQTGAPTVLADAGLKTAIKLFRDMAGPDGNLLALEPDRILVPSDLEGTARKIFISQFGIDTTVSTKQFLSNVYLNRFRPIVISELGNANYTGNSATAWYLLCNPAILATAIMCFLNGQESPTIESADCDFNTLGIQLRGYHDFGAAMAEYRAGVKSVGA